MTSGRVRSASSTAVASFADDLEVATGLQHDAQQEAEIGDVVDEQHPVRHAGHPDRLGRDGIR